MLSNIIKIALILISTAQLSLVYGNGGAFCPDANIINPCRCTQGRDKENAILCGGAVTLNLSKVFETLSAANISDDQKHFSYFYLNNTFVNELPQNVFKDITFDVIYVENATNVTKINRMAFTKTNKVTKALTLQGLTRLAPEHPDAIFEIVRDFTNMEFLSLIDNNITQIPDNAFGDHMPSKLKRIVLSGAQLRRLGNNAFLYLDALTNLEISKTRISYIPDDAFSMAKQSKDSIHIVLNDNRLLWSDSFADNAFSNIQRPTLLDFSGWKAHTTAVATISYLVEHVFQSFLTVNLQNKIIMWGHALDCSDCRNYWLTDYPGYVARIFNLKCSNDKRINDADNFHECDRRM